MTVTLKRRRTNISYREPSSDEGFTDVSEQGQKTRRKRPVPSRRSARQRPPEDEDQSASITPEPPRPKLSRSPARAKRGRRHGKVSYKDISSDEEEEDDTDPDSDFEVNEEPLTLPRKRPRASLESLPRARNTSGNASRARRSLALGAVLKPNNNAQPEQGGDEIPSDGHKPAWASLPYHVLLQIFVYASHPLYDENIKPMGSIAWLIRLATMCSSFTKPALTALYRNPPIFAMKQTRKDLVHHLISPPVGSREDYRVMVKRLELDATQMSSLTDQAHSAADLAALVQSLTTLREIDIFDPLDRPPFRERLKRTRRWVYPEELFDALRQSQLRLRSWRWNRAFCSHDLLWMKGIHHDAAFQSLREVSFTKFHPDPLNEDSDDLDGISAKPTTEELLASALAVLPHLRVLNFESCGIVSGKLLPLLPDHLVSLSIVNCGELLSDALQGFLTTHGAHLEELILHHNQALDLSFLVNLKDSCPKLEVLRMDTTYYSSLVMSSDNEPLYETLLGESEIPTWPSTLRVLDMEYLRNWNTTSATNFFSSLVESSGALPWLRSITIIAMVDTDWRQRAEFRQSWSEKFKRVFARSWKAPEPHLVSLKAFREWKECNQSKQNDGARAQDFGDSVTEKDNQIETTDGPDSMTPPLPIREKPRMRESGWESKRLRLRSKAAANYEEATDAESESGSADKHPEDDGLFVQGRCHTVMFRIDNNRPREEIYDEADFLDAEPSGDEEWDGNEDHEEEGGYAW